MTVLSADKEVNRKAGNIVSYPVGTDIVYKGALVCDDGSGYAVPAADSAGYALIGIAVENVDNSAGSPGDKSVRVYKTGTLEVAKASAAQTDNGVLMYILDDQTVAASSTNSVKAGYVVEVPSNAKVRIRIDPVVQ
jgi:predicted RecA/RadA family phage recombinase